MRSAVEVGSLGREDDDDDDDASGDVGGDSESDASGGTAEAVRFAAVDALAPRRVRARVVRLGERVAAFERSVETHGMGAEGARIVGIPPEGAILCRISREETALSNTADPDSGGRRARLRRAPGLWERLEGGLSGRTRRECTPPPAEARVDVALRRGIRSHRKVVVMAADDE